MTLRNILRTQSFVAKKRNKLKRNFKGLLKCLSHKEYQKKTDNSTQKAMIFSPFCVEYTLLLFEFGLFNRLFISALDGRIKKKLPVRGFFLMQLIYLLKI